jgi:hypothetical protein
MNRSRFTIIMVMLVLMLFSSACGAQTAAGTQQEIASGILNALDQLMPQIKLPRLDIVYDANGVPSLFGIKTTTLGSLLRVDLSFLHLPQNYVNWFTSRNLQHIEVELADDGLFLYANGTPLPYIAWSADSLQTAGALIDSMGGETQSVKILRQAFPLLRRVGTDLVLHFPRQDGVGAIQPHSRGERVAATPMETKGLKTGIQLGVAYTSDGLPTVLGMTSRDLLRLGINLQFLELAPTTIQSLQAANVASLQVTTRPDGLVLSVNGAPLPHLGYSGEHLTNAINLYSQLYGDSPVSNMARNLVPLLQAANVDLTVELPGAALAD